ncbi:Uncharacterised protein [Mycobacterium tuberculosis]|uniref:Uncharacterized protein n=1 Tax=Mycobacterium tuberculosis TaxID=1773 RepID=A0A916LB64_MYCTX|nr:Uncharacterised protein [Mycobacterium tuberculosis]COY15651.1 Uncharacterised protein [Mycobacterium tuberculosis]
MIARPVPSPPSSEMHPAASPISSTRPRDQRSIRIWLTTSKYRSSTSSRAARMSRLSQPTSPNWSRSSSLGATPGLSCSARKTNKNMVRSPRSANRASCRSTVL